MSRLANSMTAGVLALVLLLAFTMSAHAHGGEDHTDPLRAILHQGEWGLLIVALMLGVAGLVSWRRARGSRRTQSISK